MLGRKHQFHGKETCDAQRKVEIKARGLKELIVQKSSVEKMPKNPATFFFKKDLSKYLKLIMYFSPLQHTFPDASGL